MSDFTVSDFDAYFAACHDKSPFDWQRELAARVLTTGWPELLDLPTAAGKTAVIDIALFALAAQASRPPAERTAPRRMALVVDRRVVVDGAYERAEKIRQALDHATDSILKRIREALLTYGGEAALKTAVLRGGIWKDEAWARTPLQPTVLVSTVDQVGSRLLHRGYGLSPSARPIHAGLLANDTLIVLDEAHLSRPFEETLGFIARYRTWAEEPIPAPFAVVRMSATPDGKPADVFPPDPALVFNDTRLGKRLQAPKRVRCEKTKDKKDATFIAVCVSDACDYASAQSTVAVIVNRVAPARAIFKKLRQQTLLNKKPLQADVLLLTGRNRPVARDALLKSHESRIMAGRNRASATNTKTKPLIVVATQCVEAGADFDFDALVTECCPLDCLRQRLGRLNRIGDLSEAEATVIARSDIADGKANDPVYGTSASATWRWLCEQEAETAPVDLSSVELLHRLPPDLAPLLAHTSPAPLVYPAYCDLWAQTNPEADPTPDPAVFLHGPERGEPDVHFVWRADLNNVDPKKWSQIVQLCPPATGETLAVSLSTARKWLTRSDDTDDESDVEGAPEKKASDVESGCMFLIWQGDKTPLPSCDPRDVRPGDTLIVPASYGGCDAFGWAPDRQDAVEDMAAAAYRAAGRSEVFRLYPASDYPPSVLDAVLAVSSKDEDAEKRIKDILSQNGYWPEKGEYGLAPYPDGAGWALCPKHRWFEQANDLGTDDTLDGAPIEVTLAQHTAQVSRLAGLYAKQCGFPPALQEALAKAGEVHDWGKADPRFQAILYGSRIEALRRKKLLAKSIPLSETVCAKARQSSGYPQNGRHELLSVRLLEALPKPPPDIDLVKHLVESHHGYARPFVPASDDTRSIRVSFTTGGNTLTVSSATGLERLDSGVTERFWQLTRRFGWWGLSYLEALLRLADHRASETPDREVRT